MAVNILPRSVIIAIGLGGATLGLGVAAQQPPSLAALHAKAHQRLVIKNAMVIYGNPRPPYGPVNIAIENGRIAYVGTGSDGGAASAPAAEPDAIIDATGKYVMPGIVNAHVHWHEERQPGMPQPVQYERNLYLAAGVTTTRDVGSDFDKSKR